MIVRERADQDSKNLRYFTSDILDCLLSLKEENFQKSETYIHKSYQTECDVYHIRYIGPTGNADDLYVKFSFNGWITVYSFHLQR